MLSILIPVYNYNAVQLVVALQKQCEQEEIEYSIIVLDDTSTQFVEENKFISTLQNCHFIVAKEHLGRAKIRNQLANLTEADYLLFIDADALVSSSSFIHKYCEAIHKADVVVGGFAYTEKPPKENALRWHYGKKREEIKAHIRNKKPYQSIASFNILIKKSVFQQIKFDEDSIDGHKNTYGHEDTLLGLQLKERSISILHIDNPLIHNYGETDKGFLKNSLIAVKKHVTNPTFQNPNVVENIKIFRVFSTFKKYRLTWLLNLFHTLFKKSIEKKLCRPSPSLILFDLYRLSYLAHFYKKNAKK